MKKQSIIIGVIIIVALIGGGLPLAWDVIKMAAHAFYAAFVAIIPFLDLEQTVLCKIITIVIVQILCGAGIVISIKTKKKMCVVIGAVVDAIATILLLIA